MTNQSTSVPLKPQKSGRLDCVGWDFFYWQLSPGVIAAWFYLVVANKLFNLYN